MSHGSGAGVDGGGVAVAVAGGGVAAGVAGIAVFSRSISEAATLAGWFKPSTPVRNVMVFYCMRCTAYPTSKSLRCLTSRLAWLNGA